MVELTDSPLTAQNAHVFRPNHPLTLQSLREHYQSLQERSGHQVVYFHHLLNEDGSWPTDPYNNQQGVDLAFERSDKVIFMHMDTHHLLYYVKQHDRALRPRFGSLDDYHHSFDEQKQEFIDYFFGRDQQVWLNQLKLQEPWHAREFLALNMRWRDPVLFPRQLLSGKKYFDLQAIDCWTNLEQTILHILNYLDLELDQTRWNHWVETCRKWQLIHQPRVLFCWYFPQIISAILDGTDLDLGRFDLDLWQEAAIQHDLLFKHNLNLRSEQLHKFQNTRQLHLLLESNTIHDLEKIYC